MGRQVSRQGKLRKQVWLERNWVLRPQVKLGRWECRALKWECKERNKLGRWECKERRPLRNWECRQVKLECRRANRLRALVKTSGNLEHNTGSLVLLAQDNLEQLLGNTASWVKAWVSWVKDLAGWECSKRNWARRIKG